MSHTNIEQHHGYSVHGSSDKHGVATWVGSFHIAKENVPTISVSLIDSSFDTAEEAAAHALQQGRLYIDRELS